MSREVSFARAPSTLWRLVGGEVLLAAPQGLEVNRLSPAASAVWLLLDRPRAASELTGLLAEEFALGGGEIDDRVPSLLDDLEAGGWVVRTEGVPANATADRGRSR